jgi:hypothetical protein
MSSITQQLNPRQYQLIGAQEVVAPLLESIQDSLGTYSDLSETLFSS